MPADPSGAPEFACIFCGDRVAQSSQPYLNLDTTMYNLFRHSYVDYD
jgi:hypothetical protein